MRIYLIMNKHKSMFQISLACWCGSRDGNVGLVPSTTLVYHQDILNTLVYDQISAKVMFFYMHSILIIANLWSNLCFFRRVLSFAPKCSQFICRQPTKVAIFSFLHESMCFTTCQPLSAPSPLFTASLVLGK